ncbi:hypothetical protein P8C59_000522 [Phyllachora maydis]|uniref:Uncharacterized protein n=1 Tax=Phyllachora maydis TaxID=1825666 RepID=A0AAD9HXU1_9PEZI|nr:hypothetical protein P8C59_000522 [Phyllachora maydis]
MNALVFWAVLVPQGHVSDSGDLFEGGWFKPFCIINLWGTTALLAVVEIMFLNSIKRQVPVAAHAVGVTLLAVGYLGYAALGCMLTGHHAFFWMDPAIVGSRQAVAAYCSAFVLLAPAMFALMCGLIGIRETMARGHEQTIRRFRLVNEQPEAL